MSFDNIILELTYIFAGAAVLGTLFLFLRQPIIISYIVLGVILGPYGFKVINNVTHIDKMSHFGIILLLFLIGLNLHPAKLIAVLKKTVILTTVTSLLFASILGGITFCFGYSLLESLIVGIALMFSSTVIGLKLIPTTDLHNRHIGEMMISVLLFQDILAILVILFLKANGGNLYTLFFMLALKGIGISIVSYFIVQWIILPLFRRFDVIQEYIFIVAIGWCIFAAEVAEVLGLSYEIGAFIAGVCLATSPISYVISEKLKSLREFFLILFFFAVGAKFNIFIIGDVFIVSAILATVLLILKPLLFEKGFILSSEDKDISKELSWRLGQASEFSLIVAAIALASNRITNEATYVIQLTVIITFIVSTYLVSQKYKTPISLDKHKLKD